MITSQILRQDELVQNPGMKLFTVHIRADCVAVTARLSLYFSARTRTARLIGILRAM
jgi:hypothetical protein